MLRDPFTLVTLFVLPIVVVIIFRPVARLVLRSEGYAHVNGSEQLVPGMTSMFGFWLAGMIGFAIFREHGWGTWERIRASSAPTLEVLFGKSLVPIVVGIAQFVYLVTLGIVAFGLPGGLRIWSQVMVVGTVTVVCFVCMGLAVAAVARTADQLYTFTTLGMVLMGSLGGAFMPVSILPRFCRSVAPLSPIYWSMRAYREIFLFSGSWELILRNTLVVVGFAAAALVFAVLRFRSSDIKIDG